MKLVSVSLLLLSCLAALATSNSGSTPENSCRELTTWVECGTNPHCYWDGIYNGIQGRCVYVGPTPFRDI